MSSLPCPVCHDKYNENKQTLDIEVGRLVWSVRGISRLPSNGLPFFVLNLTVNKQLSISTILTLYFSNDFPNFNKSISPPNHYAIDYPSIVTKHDCRVKMWRVVIYYLQQIPLNRLEKCVRSSKIHLQFWSNFHMCMWCNHNHLIVFLIYYNHF